MTERTDRRYWGISIGEGGKYVPQARHGNFVAIGWDELGNLQRWEQRCNEDPRKLQEEFRAFYKERLPNETIIQSGINAGQAWNFAVGMKPGDITLVREPATRKIHITEVTGGYQYIETPDDGCPYQHRRQVHWIVEVTRSDLSRELNASLYSQLTIFSLDKHATEIEGLVGLEQVTGPKLVLEVIDRLYRLDPYDFQELVGHVLGLVGFGVEVKRRGPDGGVDLIGTLGVEGLADIKLQVQVKRKRSSTGSKDIQALRGALKEGGEQGAFVTLGSFTPQARQEAEAMGKKPIKLIDGETLVDMMLSHFDDMSEEYRSRLGLQKRPIPLTEHFVTFIDKRVKTG